MGRAHILCLAFEQRHGSESGRNRFIYVEVVMVYVALGVLMLFMLAGAGFYVRYDRSRAVISTSEWVRLMRKNDIQFARAKKARATKPHPS